jgi:hypothetical protein
MCLLYRNEYRNFKLTGATIGSVKRTGKGESIGGAKHICMRRTQGTSLDSYLYLKLATCHVSCFYLLVFFFFLQNWRTGGQSRFCGRVDVGTSGKVEVVRKGVGG